MSRFTHNDLVEILRLHTQEKNPSRYIASLYNCSKSTIGNFLSKQTYPEFWAEQEDRPVAAGDIKSPLTNRHTIESKTSKRKFILTSAQNNTHVHNGFWTALQRCAEHLDAEIIVGTFAYNKSGFQNSVKRGFKGTEDLWYDPKIRPYIIDHSVQMAEGLVWSGELNILPTAVKAMSGLQNYTGNDSMIIPHAKMQLDSIANGKHEETKIIYTTGCCTQANYIEKKAGQKAAHNHVYGALLVEVDEHGTWFARQLNAESSTGNFYDLTTYYKPHEIILGCDVTAIQWGDIHAEQLTGGVARASFGIDIHDRWEVEKLDCFNMLDYLRPQWQIFHDTLDFSAKNHHKRFDPIHHIKTRLHGTDRVVDDIMRSAKILELTNRSYCESVVVLSNHDTALTKWALECDWKVDPTNAEFLLECQLGLVQAAITGEDINLFETAAKSMADINDIWFLELDESFKICGIEMGAHSHVGANGARGSVVTYARAGSKYCIGHSHSATILDGVYQSGVTANLDMGYNVGLSSWSNTHCIVYGNGKRTLITIKKGKFKA